MKQPNSSLNPDAAPFFPSYMKAFPNDFCEKNKLDQIEPVGSVDLEDHPEITPLKSDGPTVDSKSCGEAPSATTETGKQDLGREFDAVTEILAAEFPNLSLESLADIFFINDGNMDDTLYMLEQLEDPISESDLPSTSNAKHLEADNIKAGEPSDLTGSV